MGNCLEVLSEPPFVVPSVGFLSHFDEGGLGGGVRNKMVSHSTQTQKPLKQGRSILFRKASQQKPVTEKLTTQKNQQKKQVCLI